jgi:hypothetical protein
MAKTFCKKMLSATFGGGTWLVGIGRLCLRHMGVSGSIFFRDVRCQDILLVGKF